MAGVGKRGKSLCGQEVLPPPVARCAVTIIDGALSQADKSRQVTAAAKRAVTDKNNRVANAAIAQRSKKRPALANLSSNGLTYTICNSGSASKSQVVAQAAVTKSKNRETVFIEPQTQQVLTSPVQKRTIPAIVNTSQTRCSVAGNWKSFQNDENVPPGRAERPLHVKEGFAAAKNGVESEFSENEAMASLERKTQHNLHISEGIAKPGDFFEECGLDGHGLSTKNYTDIYSGHKDPRLCSSYANDIYHHLRMNELKRRPKTDFMETIQQDINASMRGILIDWLVEVAEEYKLVSDTLYLTVSYIDRFLSGNVVNRQLLQLLGVSCMLVAAKYEEICSPQVEEFCYITDNTYSREEVLEMERRVLRYLHFELTGPTTKSFLRRFIRAAQAGMKTPNLQLEFLGNYLAELTLVEYSLLKYLPSVIASAAVFMAKVTLDPTTRPWDATIQHYTGYRPSELKECVQAIHDLQCNTKHCTLPAIREKYRQHKFKCVATLSPPAVLLPQFFEELDDQLS
eukprot:c23349_g1_i2 orf=384-1925(+)